MKTPTNTSVREHLQFGALTGQTGSLCSQAQMKRLFVCVVCTALIGDLFSPLLHLHKFLGESVR